MKLRWQFVEEQIAEVFRADNRALRLVLVRTPDGWRGMAIESTDSSDVAKVLADHSHHVFKAQRGSDAWKRIENEAIRYAERWRRRKAPAKRCGCKEIASAGGGVHIHKGDR